VIPPRKIQKLMLKSMIIGSNFSEKNLRFLQHVAHLSEKDTERKIQVKQINAVMEMDRPEIKNLLEHLEELGLLEIKTIGGPWLYGHVSITEKGLKKAKGKPKI
jgi:Mn-dependent DtxR family transcriptional regulator